MKNTNLLLAIALIFGLIATALWTIFLLYEINFIYPIYFNIVQFVAVAFLYKETK